MAQQSFALMTNLGRAKEAAALANGTSIQITHIAIGDGVTVPSGGETRLYNEIARKTISGSGTVVGALNTAYFDAFLAAEEGPYTIREAGLYDSAGDLIAIAHYNPPLNKPTPESGQTVEGTIRLEVAFSNVANVTIVIDPSMQVALQRLTNLPWIAVISHTVAAPPAGARPGDVYLIPANPSGSWAGHAGKIAELTAAGWAIIEPKNGHAVSLPDGRVLIRRGGTYAEFAATTSARGLIELATENEAVAATDGERALSPLAGLAQIASRLKGARTGGPILETLDWNNIVDWGFSEYLMLGNRPGGPTPDHTVYFHCLNIIFGEQITQLAIPYSHASNLSHGIMARGRYDGIWSAWSPPIRNATELLAGIVRFASNAETTAGALANRAVTPSGAAQAVQRADWTFAVATGSANAIALALTPAPAQYRDGMTVHFRATSSNTGAVTVNVNGLGVRPLRRSNGAELSSGDIPAGAIVSMHFSGAANAFLVGPTLRSDVLAASQLPETRVAFTTPGSHTFIVPAGVTSIFARLWGGGGGAGSAADGTLNRAAPSGGAGGAYAERRFPVTPGQQVTVVVGAGGIGGNEGQNGQAGTASTVTVGGVTVTAGPGQGGFNATSTSQIANGSNGGNPANADFGVTGHRGNLGVADGGMGAAIGGGGGGSPMGGGSNSLGGRGGAAGGAAPGGGGSATSATGNTPGSGARGEVQISYIPI